MGIFSKIRDRISGYETWKNEVDAKSAPARARSAVQKAEKEAREAANKARLADEVARHEEQNKLHLEEARKISQWAIQKLNSGSVTIASRQASRKKRGGGDTNALAPKFLRFEFGSITLEMKTPTGEILDLPGNLQLEVKEGGQQIFFAHCYTPSPEDDLFSVLFELYARLRERGIALDENNRAQKINNLFS